MTTRNPLVRISGKIVELPAADAIGGALAGLNGADGSNGGAITISYAFDTSTTDADPGGGKLRLNNATQNTATLIYVDLLDSLSSDWTSALDTFDDSTNTVKGSIRLVKSGDATKFLTFNVTAVTSASGYRKIGITNTASSSSSPFSNGDAILLCFDRAGDKGTDGAGSDFVKISKVVTSGSQSTITFSSIPGTYTDLMLTIHGRDTATGSNELNARLKINSDTTSSNYSSTQFVAGVGASASASTFAASSAGGVCALIPGTSGNANAVGGAKIIIPNYAGTAFHKTVFGGSMERASTFLDRMETGFVWLSTAAITDLVITAGGTAFVDGTTATLYGLG